MIRNNLDAKKRNCFFVFDNLLGESDWARRTRRRVVQLSRHRFNVFIKGPAGSGKQLIARSLHEHGPRREHPFVPVDCARLPGDLFRSQLFGQAYRETTTLGCIRGADGGTVYLANVDQLTHNSQADLLTAIESKAVQPVGAERAVNVDVRFIVGSARNLEEEVRAGRFHSELCRQLSVLPFETTALQTRIVDVVPIAHHLVAKLTFERGLAHKRLTARAVERLLEYPWPDNVRELQEVIDQAILSSADSEVIESENIHLDESDDEDGWMTLADLEAKHIRETLAITNGDLIQTAYLLGIDQGALQEKLAHRKRPTSDRWRGSP